MSTVPPPDAPPADAHSDDAPAAVIKDLEGWLLQVKRDLAGFMTLRGALDGATGQTPPGVRKKGLPVFEYKGTLDGRDIVLLTADLKRVPPAYLKHVLVPLINATASSLSESAEELARHADALHKTVLQLLAPPGESAQPG